MALIVLTEPDPVERCDQANEKVRLRCCAYLNIVH